MERQKKKHKQTCVLFPIFVHMQEIWHWGVQLLSIGEISITFIITAEVQTACRIETDGICWEVSDRVLMQSWQKTQIDVKVECILTRAQQPDPEL